MHFNYCHSIRLGTQDWLKGEWINNTKHTYIYDYNGDLKEELIQLWAENRWENQYKYTYH